MGGPGLHACVERQVLGVRLPQVNFWDQPPVPAAGDGFRTLLDAVIAEVERMSAAHCGPIRLMAHSFAAHLASELLEQIPHRIAACHLIGAVYDIPAAYLNLLGVMANAGTTAEAHRQRIVTFLEGRAGRTADKQEIRDYYRLILADAGFLRHYWPDAARYAACAADGPAFDFATFENVMDGFLRRWRDRPVPYTGPLEILIELGDRDPLLDLARERRLWQRRFPGARIIVRRGSAHFIHMESCF